MFLYIYLGLCKGISHCHLSFQNDLANCFILLLVLCWFLLSFDFLFLVFSSKDILMRIVAQNLSPELTLVEKV